MNLFETFLLDMPQCVCFVPAARKYVERDLTSDGESQVIVGELLL